MYCVHPDMIPKIDDYAESVLKIDRYTLMWRAGDSAARKIMERVKAPARILFLCGVGNNGGDGYVAARTLYCNGYDVILINVFGTEPKSEASRHYRRQCLELVREINLSDIQEDDLSATVEGVSAVVEAIAGTGYRMHSKGFAKELICLIELVNKSRAMRIAIDSPFGVNGAVGQIGDCIFKADLTLTMLLPKTGFYSYPARHYVGELVVCDIGLDIKELKKEFAFTDSVIDDHFLRTALKRRFPDSHKGSYGRLLLVCGSEQMPGAAYLASCAAVRSGAGIVSLAASPELRLSVSSRLAEPIYYTLPDLCHWTEETIAELVEYSGKFDGVLVGCGVGNHPVHRPKLRKLISTMLKREGAPLVLDADAINALQGEAELLKSALRPVVVTPHPLEFSRLSGKSVPEIQADRYRAATDFARTYGVVVVLKGAGTLIALPDGRVYINKTGNSGLAKGGSGDVLSGLIASLIAQGNAPSDAAAAGVYLHGLAADRLVSSYSEYGLLPSDLPREIGLLLGEIMQ